MICKVYKLYKLANTLHRRKVPLLPGMICKFMRFAFTTVIPYTAVIGRNTDINNWGMGTVIHGRTVIGENCMIGHGVTIGGRSGHYEVPVLGNDIIVGVGAKILGPIKVGDHVRIGANAVVLHDVPPYAVVAGIPAKVIRFTNGTASDNSRIKTAVTVSGELINAGAD
jgi:serine O-acetyltransferase